MKLDVVHSHSVQWTSRLPTEFGLCPSVSICPRFFEVLRFFNGPLKHRRRRELRECHLSSCARGARDPNVLCRFGAEAGGWNLGRDGEMVR